MKSKKVYLYYEDKNVKTALLVPENELKRWEEEICQKDCAEAEEGKSVPRRSAQNILNTEVNSPNYNNERRQRYNNPLSLEQLQNKDFTYAVSDNTKIVLWREDPVRQEFWEEFGKLPEAVKRRLLMRAEKMTLEEIGRCEGVTSQAVGKSIRKLQGPFERFLHENFDPAAQ